MIPRHLVDASVDAAVDYGKEVARVGKRPGPRERRWRCATPYTQGIDRRDQGGRSGGGQVRPRTASSGQSLPNRTASSVRGGFARGSLRDRLVPEVRGAQGGCRAVGASAGGRGGSDDAGERSTQPLGRESEHVQADHRADGRRRGARRRDTEEARDGGGRWRPRGDAGRCRRGERAVAPCHGHGSKRTTLRTRTMLGE